MCCDKRTAYFERLPIDASRENGQGGRVGGFGCVRAGTAAPRDPVASDLDELTSRSRDQICVWHSVRPADRGSELGRLGPWDIVGKTDRLAMWDQHHKMLQNTAR